MAQVFNVRSAISIHALREEGDITAQEVLQCANYFYPRPPRGGRRTIVLPSSRSTYFYPRPPRGGRRKLSDEVIIVREFLSTPSARRATQKRNQQSTNRRFLSTPSARRATHAIVYDIPFTQISIHALREEGDPLPFFDLANGDDISIHALREEGDRRRVLRLRNHAGDFYPRPPRGGRRDELQRYVREQAISIHALREEGDYHRRPAAHVRQISIHALREEGDDVFLC